MNKNERQTGMGLWTDSKEMLDAARILIKSETTIINPIYYLLGHSFEVAIKGFLLSCGADLKELKTIGHDLIKAVEHSKPYNLNAVYKFSDESLEMIKLLNKYYQAKEFEYRRTGFKSYPSAEKFACMINDVLKAIKPICRQSV